MTMINRLLTAVLLLWISLPMAAQTTWSNNLIRLLDTAQPATIVDLLVLGKTDMLEARMSEFNGHFKYAAGDVASIRIPAGEIAHLMAQPYVLYADPLPGLILLMDSVMIDHNRADTVHQALGNLPQAYTGKNVVVGILDTGLDFLHPDFQKPDSTTRVRYIWDQNVSSGGNAPLPYTYGQQWDSTHINAGTCPHKDNNSHGTKVAGNATGNGRAAAPQMGMAPEADIIIVSVDLGSQFLTKVVDGVDYIFRKAAELGKPAVVNASLGSYFGSHDGFDLGARAIDNLINARPGRAMICASGNAGGSAFHLGYELSADTNFTWFTYFNSIQYAYFQMYADTGKWEEAFFRVGVTRPSDYADVGAMPFVNVVQDFNLAGGNDVKSFNITNAQNQRLAKVDLYVERSFGRYTIDVVVTPDSNTYFFTFETTGAGRFDTWSAQSLTGTSNFRNANLPDTSQYPRIVHYKRPDAQMTMVTSWACSPHVVTVGNYHNRNSWTNVNGSTSTRNTVPGAFRSISSVGPTRIGLQKPNLTAPGDEVLTAAPLPYLAARVGSQPGNIGPGGMHFIFGGTSSASPQVAGALACYLERYPTDSHLDMMLALQATARTDTFTGTALPDSAWGYGKLDLYRLMSVERGCMDTAALNYNPLAVLPGYDPADTCEYAPPVGRQLPVAGRAVIQPNPFTTHTTVSWPATWQTDAILLYDVMGREVRRYAITSQQAITIPRHDLPSGVYFVHLLRDTHTLSIEKCLIP